MSRSAAETVAMSQAGTSRFVLTGAVIFACAFALLVFRDPSLFYEPRFWAEEATVYFHAAYVSPALTALIAPHQGYYSLWANVASIFATIPPLEYAPAVTTAIASLVPLAVIVAILVNESSALDSPLKKAVAALASVVIGTPENWLISINSQHIFPLLIFLILIDSKENAAKRRCWYAVAAVAGLSGPASNFLTPLFLLRYWQKRERADLVLFAILACTSLILALSIVYSTIILRDAMTQKRFTLDVNPVLVVAEAIHFGMAYPLFGFTPPMSALMKVAAAASAALLALSVFLARSALRELIFFPLAVVVLTLFSVFGSLNMQGGARYAYAPSVIVAMLLLAQSTDAKLSLAARTLSRLLLFASLVFWCATFRSSYRDFHQPSWPSWSSEVRTWRADPTRQLQVWPLWSQGAEKGVSWRMELPRADSARSGP
jgi:hypothetical protein